MKWLKFILTLPIAFALSGVVNVKADDLMDIPICNLKAVSPDMISDDAKGESAESRSLFEADFEAAYETTYQENTACGEPNASIGGMIEKRDCSTQVITEITEVIAPAEFGTGEGGTETEKIVNLYQGVCCYLYDSGNNTCYQTITYYTKTYDDCKEFASGTPKCSQRQWLIASSGVGLLKLYVKQIFTFGSTAVGFIAMAMLIYYGVRISASGVSGDISEYKQKILQAISGIVLLFLSGLILYTVNPDFFG
jgi:hypothetical protein